MAKPKYASLNAGMIRRGITTRRVRMIGPDGGFHWTNQVIEVDVEDRRCDHCGSSLN